MTQVRRMLGPAGVLEPLSYVASQRRHGPSTCPADLVQRAEAAALRGRGGGAFPVARKLRTAAEAPGRAVVVVNAAEGEPASGKDRALLGTDPHLVLDGAQAAARAVGAGEVVVAVHAGGAAQRLRAMLAQRPDPVATRVVEVAARYVASEASAIVSAATGGAGLPTTRRLPLARRGPGRSPWLVQNAETMAALALLARHGVDWYRAVGAADEPGTVLLTVRGAVRAPQVVEVPVGIPLGAALDCAGGLPDPPQALLVGGFAGRWLAAPGCLDVPVSTAGLKAAGGTLGAGLVVALPRTACGLATTARVVRYLADQSARQCGPCLNGLPALATAVEQLAVGRPPDGVLDRIARWCGQLPGRGACSHPDGAVALVRSALTVFAADVRQHRTASCGRPALELPT